MVTGVSVTVDGVGVFDIAKVTGLSPSYVARTFKRVFGCTIGEYTRQIRLDRATEMLTRSDLPLPDIAVIAGFYDQSHFTNIFRASTGFTPAEFRKCAQTGQARPKGTRSSNTL